MIDARRQRRRRQPGLGCNDPVYPPLTETSPIDGTPALTGNDSLAREQVFSVIPDPVCAPWEPPRSLDEDALGSLGRAQDSRPQSPPFARLGRVPGAGGGAMTAEGWIAHWQMVRVRACLRVLAHSSLDRWFCFADSGLMVFLADVFLALGGRIPGAHPRPGSTAH